MSNADVSILFRSNTVEILQHITKVKRARFKDLEQVSSSPSTLSKRVKLLEQLGIVKREAKIIPAKPVEIYYEVTEKGKELIDQYRSWLSLFQAIRII